MKKKKQKCINIKEILKQLDGATIKINLKGNQK